MRQRERDLEFDFSDALQVIKFDGNEHHLSHCMKAVDFIIELSTAYLFVEVKDPAHPSAQPKQTNKFKENVDIGIFCDDIVRKFRDSFLYRWAEKKLDKPIHFLCLLTLEEALLKNLQDDLNRRLPLTGATCWSRNIVESCYVVNIEAWNRNFPKWPVRRLSDAA